MVTVNVDVRFEYGPVVSRAISLKEAGSQVGAWGIGVRFQTIHWNFLTVEVCMDI